MRGGLVGSLANIFCSFLCKPQKRASLANAKSLDLLAPRPRNSADSANCHNFYVKFQRYRRTSADLRRVNPVYFIFLYGSPLALESKIAPRMAQFLGSNREEEREAGDAGQRDCPFHKDDLNRLSLRLFISHMAR